MNIVKKISLKHIFSPALFAALILLHFAAYSQSEDFVDKDLNIRKLKARGDHALKTGDTYTALFYYEEVCKRDTLDMKSRFQLAELYRFSRNYIKAEETYDYVFRKAGSVYPFSLYYKGLMQKMQGKYEEAKANMLQFKKEAKNLGDKNFKAMLPKEIAGCDSGIVFREFPDSYVAKNAGTSVNHPHGEFSPFLLDTTKMVYGSLRMEKLKYFNTLFHNYEKQAVRQIFQAEKVNGEWEEKGLFEIFNDPEMDMGNFVYSPLSGRYYFTKCIKNIYGKGICSIYYTEQVNGAWIEPVMLPSPVNMAGFTSTQPTIMFDTTGLNAAPVKDEKPAKPGTKPASKPAAKQTATEYLYFVSDRSGGKGGLDIWFTSYNSTKKIWNTPKNFTTVNTPGDEYTPFFHVPSQTLFFSSDGHSTSGGQDIYKIVKGEKDKFSKPQNLAFPINSPQDDLGYMLDAGGKKGVFVSNRPGGTHYFHETCCDDIYAFEPVPPKPFNCALHLTVIFPEKDSKACNDSLQLHVFVHNVATAEKSLDTILIGGCEFFMPLDRNHQYSFKAEPEGYLKDSLFMETREISLLEIIEKKLYVKPFVKETPLLDEVPVEGKVFVLKDIQYDFNDATLSDEAKQAIDSILVPFLKKFPDDKLLISSHTDSHGSHKYNLTLSHKRAESVVKYLVSKGIPHHRLEAKGFGETMPIAPNENPDGSDNPIGRSMNRRTEFLLVKPDGQQYKEFREHKHDKHHQPAVK